MWLATDGGINRYQPSSSPPGVRVLAAIADRRYAPEEDIRIPAGQRLLAFEFRGRSLTTAADRMAYVCRLTGLDSTWTPLYVGRIEYADLPTGDYTFEVKAVDQDLNYSDPATVTFSLPPAYGQIALQVGLLLSLVGLVVAATQASRRKRERDRARARLLRDQEEELQTARTMQRSLWPPGSPDLTALEVAGRCETMNHVGGDLYQYYSDESTLAVCLADVTGHAMEAAIPVVMFSGILEQLMEFPQPLTDRFQSLNRSLCRSLGDRRYVCFSMAEIDTTTRSLRLASCGCPYPLHYQAANDSVAELQVDAYPLGVRPDTTYRVIEARLAPGDYLVLYSDGIPEATDPSDAMFGFEATAATTRMACREGVSPEEVIDRLICAAWAFSGDEPQADDMTCVVVRATR
jgi:serine phosphatase RsbU (regulator of sigma subunit)